jgi:hypothetical protein
MIGEHECVVDEVSSDEIICVTTAATKSSVLDVSVNVPKYGRQEEIIQFW